MTLTDEQKLVINHIKSVKDTSPEKDKLVLVSAVSGAGKSTLLRAIAEAIDHSNGLLLAYNKSIATEASRKFPKTVSCSTIHSLAYRAVVRQNNLNIGTFTYRDVQEKIPYQDKCFVVDYLREFCLSEFTDPSDFFKKAKYDEELLPYVEKYLSKMEAGAIDVTHDFYLKLFHIMLAKGLVEYDPFDFIMLDEAGDVNAVTAEVFQLLPAKIRVAVGDPHQNIYGFNHTVNCFETLKDKAVLFHLSQSFRVSDIIAVKVEAFCRKYLNEDMSFKGIQIRNNKINTKAYITRTNIRLILKMMELIDKGIKFRLLRSVNEIFKLPLMVANFKKNGRITIPQYTHIQDDIDYWYENEDLKQLYSSLYAYLLELHADDQLFVLALRLVALKGKRAIFDTYSKAKEYEKKKDCNLVLATAHSVKGLEFDEVEIDEGLNRSVYDIISYVDATENATLLPDQIHELNLYYVACTRAAKVLKNATMLNRFNSIEREFKANHYPELLL